MAEYQINPEKLYYNYQGQFPPLVLDHEMTCNIKLSPGKLSHAYA